MEGWSVYRWKMDDGGWSVSGMLDGGWMCVGWMVDDGCWWSVGWMMEGGWWSVGCRV